MSIWLPSCSSEQEGGEGRDARGALARAGGVAQSAVEREEVELDLELVSHVCR